MSGAVRRRRETALRRWIVGLLVSGAIAGVAERRGTLTPGGAVAAMVVGTGTVGGGGVAAGLSMVLFFVTSTALTRLGRRWKAPLAAIWEKGGRRDRAQVVANGAVAAVGSVLAGFTEWEAARGAAAAALATAAADTWATEIGSLSRSRPWIVTTGKRVAPGTSGAITIAGIAAGVAGAAVTAAVFWSGEHPRARLVRLTIVTALAGAAGSFADSLIGATLQARYWCGACAQATERRTHVCGTVTTQVGGFAWCTNDTVNAGATVIGAVLGALALRG